MNKNTTFTVAEIEYAMINSYVGGTQMSTLASLEYHRTKADEKIAAADALAYRDTTKMSKAELTSLTWTLPALDDSLYRLLEDEGFITGSSVYATGIKANDIDLCIGVPPRTFKGFSLGQNKGYWEADGFSSVYAHRDGMLLNILCFSDTRLMEAWRFATNMLARLHDGHASYQSELQEMLTTKWKRVRLFNAFRDIMYEPRIKKPMDYEKAIAYHKCADCSREAIFFTCKAARMHYEETGVCERCSGIKY